MAAVVTLAWESTIEDAPGRMAAGSIALDNHYDLGGYAIAASDLGFLETIAYLQCNIPGLHTIFDVVNQKLICYAGVPAHTHDILLKNAAVVDGATTRVNAGANLLGANTGGDLTVTGGGANGGIVANAAVAAAPEVAHTTNLAAYTGTFIAFGV